VEGQLPTYENIIHLLETVTTKAERGDIVHIHYSSHGAQVTTVYPELKGPNGLDEAIAAYNICCGGRYLHDVEIAARLEGMVQKDLIVAVVLDSCHSGGAVRSGGGSVSRGIGRVDHSVLPSDASGIARSLPSVVSKHYRSGVHPSEGSWLLEPNGYKLLAACRLNEAANELENEGRWHGALTHYLLDSLKSRLPLTHGTLHRRIQAEVQRDFP
jgi:hypothetical protein